MIIGPTEDGRPSNTRLAAARYAKGLREAGAHIYVVNPGYRINENEGQEIATNMDNVKYSYYRGLDRLKDPLAESLFRGIYGGRSVNVSDR